MRFEGAQVQNAIYAGGEYAWPVRAEAWEDKAGAALEQGPFDYVAGGAGSEATMRANLEAFERRRLRPRMLAGNVQRDLSVEVLGLRFAVAVLARADRRAQHRPRRGRARGRLRGRRDRRADRSSRAPRRSSIEQVAEAIGDAPRWFQLYWVSDRKIVESFVRRAEAAGYRAIVVTLDTLMLGWRPRDLAQAVPPFLAGEGLRAVLHRSGLPAAAWPRRRRRTAHGGGDHALHLPEPGADLGRPRVAARADGAAAARQGRTHRRGCAGGAQAAGSTASIVSNHGGRQVDGAVASLDALRRGSRRARRRGDRADGRRDPHAAPTSSRRWRSARTPCSSADRTSTRSRPAGSRASRP